MPVPSIEEQLLRAEVRAALFETAFATLAREILNANTPKIGSIGLALRTAADEFQAQRIKASNTATFTAEEERRIAKEAGVDAREKLHGFIQRANRQQAEREARNSKSVSKPPPRRIS